jgi:DNA invertase Pin-like site-specific DNA recombinase
MRVAIYARVSTSDKGQDPENQLRELRAWCVNSGHTIAQEYVEAETDRKGADKRKRFAALFEDAAKRKFDLVLFWALDRFSREGMAQTIGHLQRLNSYGVSFHSYTEPHLATDNELVRNILLALLSSLAKVSIGIPSRNTQANKASTCSPKVRFYWAFLVLFHRRLVVSRPTAPTDNQARQRPRRRYGERFP